MQNGLICAQGDRKRALMIPPELIEPFRRHFSSQDAERQAAGDAWGNRDLVWCGREGQPINPHDDWETWKALLAEAGITTDARLHDARHTAGTLLGEQHVDMHVIQRILGHAQVTTTRIYTDPTDPLTREAAGLIGEALWPGASQLQPQLQPEAGEWI
jgi:site-specific recombinase XerD